MERSLRQRVQGGSGGKGRSWDAAAGLCRTLNTAPSSWLCRLPLIPDFSAPVLSQPWQCQGQADRAVGQGKVSLPRELDGFEEPCRALSPSPPNPLGFCANRAPHSSHHPKAELPAGLRLDNPQGLSQPKQFHGFMILWHLTWPFFDA